MSDQRTSPPRPPDDPVEVAPNLRPPPGNPRFPLFDSLRAIAALSVFLGHTVTGTQVYGQHPTIFVLATQLANQGVAIFFLISGFLLYRPFLVARREGRHLSVRDFARRRILRIVPAYWIALSVFLLLGFVSGVTADNWWIFYGFGQVYSFSTLGSGIGAAWTLCIEVTFYAALPLFAFLAARLGGRDRSMRGDLALLVILAAASLAFRAHFHSFASIATISTLPGTFTWFALGMALAVLSVVEQNQPQGMPLTRSIALRPTLSWCVAAALFAVAYKVSRSSTGGVAVGLSTHVLYGLVALFILIPGVFGDAEGGLARRALRFRALSWIGLVSYAFYLYHTIVIAELDKLAVEHHISARYGFVFVSSFIVSCACAAVSYYVFERPIMRLRGRPSMPQFRGRRGGDADPVVATAPTGSAEDEASAHAGASRSRSRAPL